MMNKKFLAVCLMLLALLLAGCSQEATPYENNDAENYRVSVKFDANGGLFTTNTSVIVDSFNIAEAPQGKIALIPTDHPARGNDAFAPVNNGYFLAGWYQEKTETGYAKPWNFETDVLTLAPSGSYTSSEPVLTLYAAWVPLFQVEFVDRASGELLGAYTFDPTQESQLKIPHWSQETGALEMYRFPSRPGYTLEAVWLDEAGTQKAQGQSIAHTGTVDLTTGTAQGSTMTLYTDWTEGEWYHIYNTQQLLDNASVTGSYVLHADLDFTGEIWPTSLMYGSFAGTIEGNGHTISNVEFAQTNNSKVNAGLFGRLAETAVIRDLTFENVTFTIQSGTRVAGTSYGLFAGAIADTAKVENVQIHNSTLAIDSRCYFGVEDYTIGLLCGMGDETLVDYSGISCIAVGSSPETVQITVEGNYVNLHFGA